MVSAPTLSLRLKSSFKSHSTGGCGSSCRSDDGDELQATISDEHGDGSFGLRFKLATSVTPKEKQNGAVIYSIIAGSPADKSGLQPMDLLTAVNGQPITSSASAVNLLSKSKWPVTLRARRKASIREAPPSPSEMFDHLLLEIPAATESATVGITKDK
eukprot:4804631-Pleurochrysis_carterae.AAC.1